MPVNCSSFDGDPCLNLFSCGSCRDFEGCVGQCIGPIGTCTCIYTPEECQPVDTCDEAEVVWNHHRPFCVGGQCNDCNNQTTEKCKPVEIHKNLWGCTCKIRNGEDGTDQETVTATATDVATATEIITVTRVATETVTDVITITEIAPNETASAGTTEGTGTEDCIPVFDCEPGPEVCEGTCNDCNDETEDFCTGNTEDGCMCVFDELDDVSIGAGVVIGVLAGIALVLCCLVFLFRRRRKKSGPEEPPIRTEARVALKHHASTTPQTFKMKRPVQR